MWAAQSRLICWAWSGMLLVCVGEFQRGVRAVEAWVASAWLRCIVLGTGESHVSLRPTWVGVERFLDLSRKSGVNARSVSEDDCGTLSLEYPNVFPVLERSIFTVMVQDIVVEFVGSRVIRDDENVVYES
ncbi:hypothetical protein OUZ56_031264 [Daphnia magna]|uniref:Secreted protein n=1 Tax=Daphnia magna TaxID=35525 RepID=A0ABQ9ZUK7_9CRUS|nr:hypothetical protein OUZ56_031264 [Daphnia magna]